MKVLQVVPELSAGGVERTTIEIAQALTAAGHSAHVASAGGRLEGELAEAGGILHRMAIGSKNPLRLRANTQRLIALIKAHGIDIVHARSRAPAWPAHAAARHCAVPFVTTYHGIYNGTSRLKRRYNAVMAKGDIIIANSEFTREHIIKTHHSAPEQIQVIARGVDMARFDASKVPAARALQLRSDWGVTSEQTCLLLPGRLTAWKGQKVAIKALAHLPDHFALVLLGDAQGREDYVSELEALCLSLGLSERVSIAGHSADMPSAFAASDIVLSCSTDPEAFGRVAAEAQAMGKWVIASDHGGSRETIIEGITGNRVTPGDEVDLARCIRAYASVNPDAQAMRSHIESHFSDALLKSATLAVYARVLESRD